jgi:DeoR/GlpR family transcriptional regulator of sugar metabolism
VKGLTLFVGWLRTVLTNAPPVAAALATSDKLRTVSPWFVAPLAEVTHLVTDAQDDLVAEDTHAGVSVVRA